MTTLERNLSFAEFETECRGLAIGWIPGATVTVAEVDYRFARGVAAEWPDGARQGVRGRARTEVLPWYWRRPFHWSRASRTRHAMQPIDAIKALSRWAARHVEAQWEEAWEASRKALLSLPDEDDAGFAARILNGPGPGEEALR